MVIKLRNRLLPSIQKQVRKRKSRVKLRKRVEKKWKLKRRLEKSLREKIDNNNNSDDEVRLYAFDQFIDKKSSFRRIEKQILSYLITLNHLTRL